MKALLLGTLLLFGSGISSAFTFISQNMAEFSDADPRRIGLLLESIEAQNPEVIFLQEAEYQTLRLIRTQKKLAPYRAIYQETRSIPSGGLIILANRSLSPSHPTYTKLPSEMDRGLLLATVTLCGKPVTLVDLHLESPDLMFWRSNALRGKQIGDLKKILIGRDDFIIAGDWNFVFDSETEKLLPADWLDAWVVMHPSDSGLTWAPKENKMAWWAGGFILPGYRLDRILIKSKNVKIDSTMILKKDKGEDLSDHHGLLSSINCSG